MVFSAQIISNDARNIQMYHSNAFRIPENERYGKELYLTINLFWGMIHSYLYFDNKSSHLTRDHRETMRNGKVPHVRICLRLITKGFTYTQELWNTIDRTLINKPTIDVWRSIFHFIHCNSYIDINHLCVDHYLFIPSSMANILRGFSICILLLWL